MHSVQLSSTAQAAYAEILDIARRTELERSVQNLSGSFNRKLVRGTPYWYYQYTDVSTGATKQFFVGPDNERIHELVKLSQTVDRKPLERLTKAAIELGCSPTTPVHYRIVRRLSEIGFFKAGGVLVGTYAFLTLGNALGVGWGNLSSTRDIDFAHAGQHIEFGLPTTLQVQTRNTIESLEAGFLPTPGFQPWEKTVRFASKADKALTIDFLSPMKGGRDQVYEHAQLGVNLQPMKFMEFILEDVQQAAVLSPLGACIVNVPDAARFAFHKLIVYVERRNRSPEKAKKDLAQCAELLFVLWADQSERLEELWGELCAKGPGWRQHARKGLAALEQHFPELPAIEVMKSACAGEARRAVSVGR